MIQALLTAQVRRVVLDARSTVIDLGERKRLFTGNARIAATLLERFCNHTGCEVPADRCQIDHNQSHTDGGRTDQANAGPECGPHNRFKYRTVGEHEDPTTAGSTTSDPTALWSCSSVNDHPSSPEPTTTTESGPRLLTSNRYDNTSNAKPA